MPCQESLLAAASKLWGPSQDDFWLCESRSYLQSRAQEGLDNLVLFNRHGEQVDLLQGLDLALQPGMQLCAQVKRLLTTVACSTSRLWRHWLTHAPRGGHDLTQAQPGCAASNPMQVLAFVAVVLQRRRCSASAVDQACLPRLCIAGCSLTGSR